MLLLEWNRGVQMKYNHGGRAATMNQPLRSWRDIASGQIYQATGPFGLLSLVAKEQGIQKIGPHLRARQRDGKIVVLGRRFEEVGG
jgi:hypothetical protein